MVIATSSHDLDDALIDCLGCAYQRDKSIGQLADLPPGWRAYRESADHPWVREEKEPEPDEDEPGT